MALAQRRFSTMNLLLLSVNGTIGSAWLFAPLYAARLAGPHVLLAWLLGGLATLLIALTFAEISSLLPIAGGSARFAELSHGRLTGFVISWITWLSSVTMAPIECQAVLQYCATRYPALMHAVHGTPELTSIGLFFAVLLMLALSIINVASFRGLIGTNFVLFIFKIGVIAATIFMLIHTHFVPGNFTVAVESGNAWHGVFAAIASGGIAFAFTGFKHGIELAGETQDPHKSIPRAIIGSIVICVLLYLGLQVAFIGSILPEELAQGWGQLHFSGDLGPFIGIAAALGLSYLVIALFIDAAVSPLGAGLIYTTSTARLVFAMSKNGYLPAKLSKLSKNNLPIAAIAVNFLVGLLLFLPLPGWQNMVSFLVAAIVIAYAMGPIVLICLRKNLPDHARAFRLPCANVLCLIAFYFCNLLSYWTGWETLSKLAIAVGIGLVILISTLGLQHRKKVHVSSMGLRGLWWLVPYLLGLMAISYCGSFGGHHWLSFGWDFLVIALFSILIFYSAIATRQTNIAKQFAHYQGVFNNEMVYATQ